MNTAAAAKLPQSCPTLCDPLDGSPPGSSVHGIFQARVLESGAIAFSMMNTNKPKYILKIKNIFLIMQAIHSFKRHKERITNPGSHYKYLGIFLSSYLYT